MSAPASQAWLLLQRTVFRWIGWLWRWAGGWPGRLAVAGCVGAACLCFFLVGGMLWRGTVWAYVVYAERPYAHFAGGVFFLVAAWVLVRGYACPPAVWRRLLGRLALLGMGLVLAFAAGEFALRVALIRQREAQSLDRLWKMRQRGQPITQMGDHPLAAIIQPSDDVRLVYELQPNIATNFGHHLLRTNRDGMREDRAYARARSPHSVRIAGIGDSGMFGWNVEQNEDYLAVLESLLQARGDGVTYEVLNLAVPGYNTQLEVERLRHLGLAFQPDVVVVGWCVNDYQLPFFMLEKEDFRRKDLSYLDALMFNRTNFAEMVAGVHVRPHPTDHGEHLTESMKSGTGIDGVRRAFRDLQTLSETHGFRVLVFGPLGADVIDLCREAGLAYYNTYEHIPPGSVPADWCVHFMHPRPNGHRLLAEHLAVELQARGWLAPRERVASEP